MRLEHVRTCALSGFLAQRVSSAMNVVLNSTEFWARLRWNE